MRHVIRIRGCDLTVDEASELADRLAAREMNPRDESFVKALRRRVEAGDGGLSLSTHEAPAIVEVTAAWVRERRELGLEVERLEKLHATASTTAGLP